MSVPRPELEVELVIELAPDRPLFRAREDEVSDASIAPLMLTADEVESCLCVMLGLVEPAAEAVTVFTSSTGGLGGGGGRGGALDDIGPFFGGNAGG